MLNKIILGNCYELIKKIPDNSIDLVIIDPPYEFDMGGGGGRFGTKERNYHNEYLSLYHETGSTKETERLRVSANKQKQRYYSAKNKLGKLVFVSKDKNGNGITYRKSKEVK